MTNSKKIAYCAMLTALSMIFAYIETLIPFSFGIPGIKLGLANLVVLTGLYFMPAGWVFTVLVLKVTLVSFLFGNLSMLIYSMAGGIVSFLVMLAVKKRKGFSIIGVSIAGGVSHNLGQLAVAAFVVESIAPLSYMPVLMIAGTAAGTVIGMVAYRVRKHLGKTYISGEK
ncbi:MAG: Gx transporter family protein [Lachnospiraceae bacterium]|nr:Gx transporter family protein [Lachnospiraceae bacterium]